MNTKTKEEETLLRNQVQEILTQELHRAVDIRQIYQADKEIVAQCKKKTTWCDLLCYNPEQGCALCCTFFYYPCLCCYLNNNRNTYCKQAKDADEDIYVTTSEGFYTLRQGKVLHATERGQHPILVADMHNYAIQTCCLDRDPVVVLLIMTNAMDSFIEKPMDMLKPSLCPTGNRARRRQRRSEEGQVWFVNNARHVITRDAKDKGVAYVKKAKDLVGSTAMGAMGKGGSMVSGAIQRTKDMKRHDDLEEGNKNNIVVVADAIPLALRVLIKKASSTTSSKKDNNDEFITFTVNVGEWSMDTFKEKACEALQISMKKKKIQQIKVTMDSTSAQLGSLQDLEKDDKLIITIT